MAIREALLELIVDKPVTQVTTTELCREANINRNTFYAHYSTPENVLTELEEELLAEMASMLDEDPGDGEVTLIICQAIADSQKRWHALWHGNSNIIERAIALCHKRTLARWNLHESHNSEMHEIFLQSIMVGASGVVEKWIEDGCEIPPEQLGNLINSFAFEGMRAISE